MYEYQGPGQLEKACHDLPCCLGKATLRVDKCMLLYWDKLLLSLTVLSPCNEADSRLTARQQTSFEWEASAALLACSAV